MTPFKPEYAGKMNFYLAAVDDLLRGVLNGFGNQNPAPYCASKTQNGTLVGGISNGITGRATDGSGIQWTSGSSCGEDWRWVEQWLPHSAWYMVAIAALTH